MAAAIALMLGSCGGDEPPATPAVTTAPAATASAVPGHPTTEEALIEALTDAFEARDLVALKRFTTPELGADLHRMHGQDPAVFWGRAQRWITRVRAGFKIAQKQSERSGRWRALLHFKAGDEETVEFARVEGKILFAEL